LTALREIDAPARSAELGGLVARELRERDLPGVREVRGAGLMVRYRTQSRVTPVIPGLAGRGVLALVAEKNGFLRLAAAADHHAGELRRLADAVEETLTMSTD